MRSDIAAAVLSLACFGFLALMAWTGKLAGIDSTKVRLFAWIVEDVGVGQFGRAGATALFVGLGLASVPAVLWVRRRFYFG
ncbi:hypothetical protein [Erythrobacter colymbi]|uniref:hypothetical protein n=1 Tax=Erythrobacter colymbi TaxID=1161202 RepID=UPI000A379095|nr:hypothetical protein [Erythrobacter colymbi]